MKDDWRIELDIRCGLGCGESYGVGLEVEVDVKIEIEFVFEGDVMGVGVAIGALWTSSEREKEEDSGELVEVVVFAPRKADLLVGVGVAGDEALNSSRSVLLSPFSLCFSSPPPLTAPPPAPRAKSALLPVRPLPCGGSFTANSCAPGIGGGRNDDDGEGKGEELGGVSIWRERRGC